MSDIPEDIRKQAEACLTPAQWNPDTVDAIARAILAERESERERCAQQLEAMIARRRKEFPRRYLANAYIQACASAIRRGPSPISKANPLSARGFSNAEQTNSPAMAHEVRSASTDAPETQGKQCTSVVSKDGAGQNLAGNPIPHSLQPLQPTPSSDSRTGFAVPSGNPITHRKGAK